jgi:DNA polymerase III epsilon subunit-like protein
VKTITVLKSFSAKRKPTLPVDPFVAKLNHYNVEEWKDSVSLEEGLEKTFDLMRDSWHAGSNPKFDADFLKVAADSFHWDYPRLASYHLLDVSNLALKLFLEGKVEKLKQESLASYFNLGKTEHRALGDAIQCMNIFAKLYDLKVVDETNK